jgi:hypothetical protein
MKLQVPLKNISKTHLCTLRHNQIQAMDQRYGSSILECLNHFQVKDLEIDIVLKIVMNTSSMAL